jgi:alanine racemase
VEGAEVLKLLKEYVSWAEIDLAALRYNFNQVKRRIGKKVKILAAVKANAYGHGIKEVSHTLEGCGADYLGVAFPDEGIELRDSGIKLPVLIFSQALSHQAKNIVKYNLTASVGSIELARAISEEAARQHKIAIVHIKVDTGMGRLGVRKERLLSFLDSLFKLRGIAVEGIYTHFPSADEKDSSFTLNQISRFKEIIKELSSLGYDIPIRHTANSAAIINFRGSFFNLIRPGLMLYGMYPSPSMKKSIKLKPVLSLKTRISFLKDVPSSTPISYNRTYLTKAPTRIGILPVGYADGFSRNLSNKGEVLVNGTRCRVIGRICMDHTMIDLKNTPAKIGDEVILIGKSGADQIRVEDVAEKIDTIPHEIVSRIGPRIQRIFKKI